MSAPVTDPRGIPRIGNEPYSGPVTGEQLAAVDALELLAQQQERERARVRTAPGAATEPFRAYNGPRTGEIDVDQMAMLEREQQRASPPRPPKRQSRPASLLREHAGRLASFSVIGALVLALGVAVQWALIRAGAGTTGSYIGQAVFSIELSYVLNKRFTWRDRPGGLAAWWRFSAQKLGLTVPNLALYSLFAWLGIGWLAANLITTAVFTLVNYAAGDRIAFAASRMRTGPRAPLGGDGGYPLPSLPEGMTPPSVSIVIPCKGNQATILATVGSLLGQDYPNLLELILVGDVGDSTWAALADVDDPRLVLLEQEKTPGARDPNVKRARGLARASGDVLAVVDSDIVMGPGWLAGAVALLVRQHGGLVAGGMRAIDPSRYWPRFVDGNALAAKTSRVPRPYQVTAENFGARGRKPPLTANAVFTRATYRACPLDPKWAYGYEDYEWYWRMAQQGIPITYHGGLTGDHHHRLRFRQLAREYRRSAQGCAQFVRRHPDSPLARKREAQALGLPVAALAVAAAAGAGIAEGFGLAVAAVAAVAVLAVSAREAVQSRSAESIAYPAAAAVLGGIFTFTLAASLLRPAGRTAPVWDAAAVRALPKTPLVVTGAALVLGLAARLLFIGRAPEWQLDEITYSSIAESLIRTGRLGVPVAYGQSYRPFLYHPPFYVQLLATWFRAFGSGITQARVLGVLSAVAALGLLAVLLRRLHGPAAAAFATVLLASDGWLIFSSRVSYIENLVLVLVMAALLLYERATGTGRMRDYLLAGAATGAAAAFNLDAGYLIVVLAVCWLLTRRHRRQHAAAIGTALAVTAVSFAGTAAAFGSGGWVHDTLVQFRRVAGDQPSPGDLTGPGQFLTLLAHQYALFLPSLAVAAVAVSLLGWRLYRCARTRALAPLGPEPVLPAWCIGALAVFGPAGVHYPQYFTLILVPLYSYLWVSAWPWLARIRGRAVAVIFTAAVVVLGLGSAALRLEQDSSAFAQLERYSDTRIPAGDMVVAGTTGDPVAYVLRQRFCSPSAYQPLSAHCLAHARYVITWQTTLQPADPLHLASLDQLIAESRPVAVFRQFSGKVIVWKVRR